MSSYPFVPTSEWQASFPGAIVASLAVNHTANPVTSDALDEAKRALEQDLRTRWAGKSRADIRADPVLSIYHDYYKRFGQNYHVQMQIESIALKGKAIPSRAALVEAMFMAELSTGILTAVHDIDQLTGSVRVILTDGSERYVRYDGVEEQCKPGDMAMRDETGILTSIVQGPTAHARATAETESALFCLYAPAGIPEAIVRQHLGLIAAFVGSITPGAIIADPVILVS